MRLPRNFRRLLASSRRLPDAILAELVSIIYTGLLPLVVMTVAMTCVGILLVVEYRDPVIAALVAVAVLVVAVRVLAYRAFNRQRATERDAVRRWEDRYAMGSYAFALTLGLFNARAMMFGDPLTAMFITALVFGYGCGLVTRLAVRPFICVVSLGLSVAPTMIGFLGYALFIGDDRQLMLAYLLQAVLIGSFAIASLQMVGQFYETTLQQLLAK